MDRKNLLLLLLLLLLVGCAQQGVPTGGPKDVEPPKLEVSAPDSFTTRFEGQTVIFYFDEFFSLVNPKQNILISPPPAEEPEFLVRKKRLEIHFQEPLQANTTYQINLSGAIKDFNEGNELSDFVHVFSTGPDIDSLGLHSQIVDAFSWKAKKDVTVLLYPAELDSPLLQDMPYYLSKADESGHFSFGYLPQDTFSMFALIDKNSNLIWDEGEPMAFLQHEIRLPDSVHYQLRLSTPVPAEPSLKSSRLNQPQHLSFFFNKTIDSVQFFLPEVPDSVERIVLPDAERDTFQLFLSSSPSDSIQAIVHYDGIIDTSLVRKPRGRGQAGETRLGLMPVLLQGKTLQPDELLFRTTMPVVHVGQDSVVLLQDSLPVPATVELLPEEMQVKLMADFKPGAAYTAVFPRGTFTALNGLQNDSLEVPFTVPRQEDLGVLAVSVENVADLPGQALLQLVNEKQELVEEFVLQQDTVLRWNFLQPGIYRLRAVVDANENGRWDPGILNEKQPEWVIYFPQELTVRANWELVDNVFELKLED